MDFETARTNMVDSQIRTTDVTSHPVLRAFLDVPREAFVPDAIRKIAYVDENAQICPASATSPARYLASPSPLARLLQLAAVTKDDVVLEIGGGTGYVSALLSILAGSVVSIDSDQALVDSATATLARLGYDNVAVVHGALENGYPGEAPYDLIFISGSVEEVPQTLLSQLREGGRLVAVVGYGNAARATVFTRSGNSWSANTFFNASIAPLPGFRKAREFVF